MNMQTNADGIQSQACNSPIIVGDRYELAETVGTGYVGEIFGGLVAKHNGQAALLSMSGSGKFQIAGSDGELQALRQICLFKCSPTNMAS